MPACVDEGLSVHEFNCRDSVVAAELKIIAIIVIFAASALGITSPMILAKSFAGKPVYEKATLVIKCYAAGLILSTALVHVLPDAFDALGDCAVSSLHLWNDFPFAGLFTLVGALLALLVDLAATSSHHHHGAGAHYEPLNSEPHCNRVAMRLSEGNNDLVERENELFIDEEMREKMRQKMISQVLEIGIIFHSVIIGAMMGLCQNVCTLRPLVGALAFHQIFEGMGLGGCIAQAGFSFKTATYMCFMFAVTTPLGIILGMIIFAMTGYDDSSANALIFEGLLGSLSSGILIYMALVDLISADFFHNKLMSSEVKMKKGCFIALALGSASMSILALWA